MELYNFDGYTAVSDEIESIELKKNGLVRSVYFPLKIDMRNQVDQFSVFLYRRSESIENEIKVVLNNDNHRIGWIFPIQSLLSNDHAFSDNVHFLNYAKAAIVILGIEQYEKLIEGFQNNIDEFYNNNTHVLCICKENEPSYCDDDYFASFYKYGYFRYTNASILKTVEYPTQDHIRIYKAAETINSIEFIRKIFTDYLPTVESDILYYYYLYQIFELLMEQSLHIKLTKILGNIDIVNVSATILKEALEDVQETLSEKKRITAIIDAHDSPQFKEYGEIFKISADNFFTANRIDLKDNEHIAHRIYRIRNALFHTLHKLPNIEPLKDVNNSLAMLIACIIETLVIERL